MVKVVTCNDGVTAIAMSALKAQQARIRIISENIANADSTGRLPGSTPYQRQSVVFEVAETEGGQGVRLKGVEPDTSPFGKVYKPGDPAADAAGYVLTSNVNGSIETLDLKEATRAYNANLNMIESQDAMEKGILKIIKKV